MFSFRRFPAISCGIFSLKAKVVSYLSTTVGAFCSFYKDKYNPLQLYMKHNRLQAPIRTLIFSKTGSKFHNFSPNDVFSEIYVSLINEKLKT